MKKYLIISACAVAFAFVLAAGETRFEFVQEIGGGQIEIKDRPTTVIFVGDMMLGRNVENLMIRNGANYPFKNIDDFLLKSDGVVANLEGPIISSHIPTISNSLSFSFASSTASLLAEHNFAVVSLANNHAYDKGISGFKETKKYLDESGIFSVGVPYEINEMSLTRRTIRDIPFIFVAFNFTHPGFGVSEALSFVRNIKRDRGDFLVAMIHGGEEYEIRSNASQQKFYRALVDAGADVVFGHHPHVVQEVEEYKGKPIFYSLGNFIFDQYFSKEVEEGLIVKLTLSETDAQYELVPILGNHSQPLLALKSEPNKIITISR